MPVSPDGGIRFAKALSDLYSDAAAHLIGLVATRLASGIEGRGWAEQKLSEILRLRRDAQRFVATLGDEVDASLYDLLAEAYSSGVLAAGGPGVQAAAPGIVATNRGAVQAYAGELAGTLRTTHTRILRTAEDVYRDVIADVAGRGVAGAQTRHQVASDAVRRFAARGVTGFVDRAGRNWELGSYVEMASRTSMGQAHIQGGLDRYTQQGRYLVIVSNAPEECEKCRPYEGRVLSMTGREPPPSDLGEARYAGTLEAAKAEGFMHPNCRHALDAFVPGLTRPPRGATEDPEGDQLRQQQRGLERSVREAKRRLAASKAMGFEPHIRQDQERLRVARESLTSFLDEHGRKAYVSARRENLRVR